MSFVLEASRKALSMATPEIMNSDQGSHFTSHKFTDPFLKAGSKISMDHRGRAFDNILIERLWRTIKYENVYTTAPKRLVSESKNTSISIILNGITKAWIIKSQQKYIFITSL